MSDTNLKYEDPVPSCVSLPVHKNKVVNSQKVPRYIHSSSLPFRKASNWTVYTLPAKRLDTKLFLLCFDYFLHYRYIQNMSHMIHVHNIMPKIC